MENFTLSEIRIFGFSYAPKGWAVCDGSLLYISQNPSLYGLIGTRFGGDGRRQFALPDLRGKVMIGSGKDYPSFARGGENSHPLTEGEMPRHSHQAIASSLGVDSSTPEDHFWASNIGYRTQITGAMNTAALEATGTGLPHNNMSPFLSVNYCIAIDGHYPTDDYNTVEDTIGTIRAFPKVVEQGIWIRCDGRLLPIAPFPDLFSLIGTTYGGDGMTTFAVPDLHGRAVVGAGDPPGLSPFALGETAGQATVTLTKPQMPIHSHYPLASLDANSQMPDNLYWARQNLRPAPSVFAQEKGTGAVMHNQAIGETGGDGPHNNMMAYQTMEYMIRALH